MKFVVYCRVSALRVLTKCYNLIFSIRIQIKPLINYLIIGNCFRLGLPDKLMFPQPCCFLKSLIPRPPPELFRDARLE
jgi:hypothetical protein